MALLRLPAALRAELKEPLGPVLADVEVLREDFGRPLIAVGDIVAHHLDRAGLDPDVAVIDGRTERRPVGDAIEAALPDADRAVENPAGTLTEALLSALREAVTAEAPVWLRVEGEEDLAALPAILAAPDGASVVYGQPGEGMVHVRVTPDTTERARDLLERMDGDPGRALALLAGEAA